MSRFLYTLCFYLAQPLVWLRLLWRARKQPEYLQHLGERYGFYKERGKREEGREKPGATEMPCAKTGLEESQGSSLSSAHPSPFPLPPSLLWIHLVSVGETRAAEP